MRCGSVKRVTTGVLQAMLVCSCYYHMGPDSSVDGDLWQRKVDTLSPNGAVEAGNRAGKWAHTVLQRDSQERSTARHCKCIASQKQGLGSRATDDGFPTN